MDAWGSRNDHWWVHGGVGMLIGGCTEEPECSLVADGGGIFCAGNLASASTLT